MESSEVSNQLLKNKYDLHNAPEVDTAVKRTLTVSTKIAILKNIRALFISS